MFDCVCDCWFFGLPCYCGFDYCGVVLMVGCVCLADGFCCVLFVGGVLFVGWIGCCYFVCGLFVVLIVVGGCLLCVV